MMTAVESAENRAAGVATPGLNGSAVNVGGGAADTPEQLEARVAELVDMLVQTREALDHAERRHQIDLALIQADAIDLETARLLTEQAVSQMSSRDVSKAVRELKQRKAFLFRPAGGATGLNARGEGGRAIAPGAMGARNTGGASAQLRASANEAATTGDRAALLRYLRARRGE
ncbi:MAG: hypothetical protein ACKVZJ_09155 [Phycisphaerales bacterium]